MRRAGVAAAFSILLAYLGAGPAAADTQGCAEFRQNIIDMENTSVRPPGWAKFDGQLRMAYVKQCLRSPTRKVADEYWFRADGTPLGIRADYSPPGWDPSLPAWRPDGGAFIATPEIGAACAQTPNPSVCAMAKGIEADCRTPVDTQERNQCAAILNGDTPDLPPPGEPLPSMSDWFGPARLGAPRMSDAQVWADPGFQRMCDAADANNNTCRRRQLNMRSIGTTNTGSTSQAGAFLECQQIYSAVLNMCHSARLAAGVPDKPIPANPPPKPAPQQQAKQTPQQPPKPNPGQSQAPPPPSSGMTPKCQQLVSSYVAAAQANDGPRALAGYNALKGAGGCNVLAQVDRPMPQASATADDPRFVARGATPYSDQVVGGCDASPAECQRRVEQLRAGVSPEAQAALVMNAISIGLQLGATVANGMAATMPQGGGTNMNSIGNRPVQHTYGQGAPTYRTPRNTPSDITGTK